MENMNDNNTKTITTPKIKPLTKNIRNKLEQKAYYLIDNIRRRDGDNPFYKFDTYHEEDSKTGGYIYWKPLPLMIKNVFLQHDLTTRSIYLLEQEWFIKKQKDSVVCLVQKRKKSKQTTASNEELNLMVEVIDESGNKQKIPRACFLKAEREKFNEALLTEKVFEKPLSEESGAVELTDVFNFSQAFVDNGSESSIRHYFNLSLKTFEAILDEFKIKVADNELSRETEAFYTDKKTQTIYMISQNELMGLIQHTGIFKTGKHSNQNLRLTAITEQFNVVKPILADENRYNPIKIVFDNSFGKLTPTNETKFIDQFVDCFIINHGGDLKYEQACKSAIKKFLISSIAAIYRPVFNSRLAPVFVGRQLCGKSSFGKKIFEIVESAFLTFGGMKIDKPDHQEQLYRGWVLEIADSPKIFRQQDAFEAYKSLTNPVLKTKRKYENHITTFNRHSVHYFTMNEIDLRDDENTRNPVIRLLAIDVNKIDRLLGLRHLGHGVVEVQNPQKRFELWHQVKCCYDRGESYELTAEEQKLFAKFINKNNKKTVLAVEFEDMFGITEGYEYKNFLMETKKGARYQVVNLKIITNKLAEILSTANREVIPQDLDKKTGELNTLINRYFPDANLKSIPCPVAGKKVKGFKTPVMLNRSEQEALDVQRQENKGKDNIALLNNTNNEKQYDRDSTDSYQSEYTQEELQKMAEDARL